jgi:hypothetical protein
MAIPIKDQPVENRYLGNSSWTKMEVHDIWNEKSQCQITEIRKAGHAVVFDPDTLAQAHKEGYDNCAYCIGDSKR